MIKKRGKRHLRWFDNLVEKNTQADEDKYVTRWQTFTVVTRNILTAHSSQFLLSECEKAAVLLACYFISGYLSRKRKEVIEAH